MPDQTRKLSILWINLRLLHPLVGGDRIRTYHMLRALKRTCRIHYFCPKSTDDAPSAETLASEYCDALTTYANPAPKTGSTAFYARTIWNCLTGRAPFIANKYFSREAAAKLAKLGNLDFDLVVCDYLPSMIHVTRGGFTPAAPLLLFQHNVESLIWRRHVESAPTPLHRWVFRREHDLTRQYEDACAAVVSGQVTVSPEEARHFEMERGMPHVLGFVPTGVDCAYFQPCPDAPADGVAFLGAMDWRANVDAVQEFASQMWPSIRQNCPSAEFVVVGRNPPAAIRDLAGSLPGIHVTGTVEDVRPHLRRASIMVLPLRIGGGTRIKVFEAMAAGLAVVSTRVGAEGLPVEDGNQLLYAESPQEFVDTVTRLIRNPAERSALAQRARDFVVANHSWERAADDFIRLASPLIKGPT